LEINLGNRPLTTATTPKDDGIDREAPRHRPAGLSLMHHRWAKLLFLHWEVPVEVIRALVPSGLEIDTFGGRAYVGLVPFTMTGVRPSFAPPIWGLSSFHEVNVRTYVHYQGRDPGVWFFSLDAASTLGVLGARWTLRLPYHRARMSLKEDVGPIDYRSERLWPGPTPAGCQIRYEPEGEPAPAASGTLDFFLLERYILYSRAAGRLLKVQVHHRPYPAQGARVDRLEESLLAASGIKRPAQEPIKHYAAEVRVSVFPPRAV
jgi:uncharacterized protein YqjF (DUF2071 family)